MLGKQLEPSVSALGLMDPASSKRIGVCCSGGGIRSAAFNLGALQQLQKDQVLAETRYLAAVSGGSYIAASYCMVAQADSNRLDSDPDLIRTQPPYSAGSPEEQYLRNHCAYLAPGGLDKLYLVFRVLAGLIFNLFLLGLPLFVLGVTLATWLYGPNYGHLAGRRCRPQPQSCFSAHVPGAAAGTLVGFGVVVVILGAVALLRRPQALAETWTSRVLVLSGLAALLLLGLPELLALVRDKAHAAAAPTLPAVAGGGVGRRRGGARADRRTHPGAPPANAPAAGAKPPAARPGHGAGGGGARR